MFNYKKIIKKRKSRVKFLQHFSWVSDKTMIRLQYRIKFGRKLNLKSPKRFTEKLQWYKLYYYNPLMPICAGKNLVRKYVESKGLISILNEQYGVYQNEKEINFSSFPNEFVLKATVGSASQQIYICRDKTTINENEVREKIKGWLDLYPNNGKRKHVGREWPYDAVKTEIVAEKFIDSSSCPDGLVSYKIFCFNGEPRFVYMIVDVKDGYFDADYGIYDADFNRLPYNRVCEANLLPSATKPKNWSRMIEIAKILSKDFPHVRIDLYNIDGNIIFGEMTFFNDSGYMKYDPDVFDYLAGDMFTLPLKTKKPKHFRRIVEKYNDE